MFGKIKSFFSNLGNRIQEVLDYRAPQPAFAGVPAGVSYRSVTSTATEPERLERGTLFEHLSGERKDYLERRFFSGLELNSDLRVIQASLDRLANDKRAYSLDEQERRYLSERLIEKASAFEEYSEPIYNGFRKAAVLLDRSLDPSIIEERGVRRLKDNKKIYSFEEIDKAIGIY